MGLSGQNKECGLIDVKHQKYTFVYVMNFKKQIRVGITGNIRQREARVYRGTGDMWKILGHTELCSKLEAAAVEAVAHLLLAEYEYFDPPKGPRKSIMQVFICKPEEAKNAIKKAAHLLKIKASWIIV